MGSKKILTKAYVEELLRRVEAGERPQKDSDEISKKMFIHQMMPCIRTLQLEQYTLAEIARFIGYVSAEKLEKALGEAAASRKLLKKQKKAAEAKVLPPKKKASAEKKSA